MPQDLSIRRTTIAPHTPPGHLAWIGPALFALFVLLLAHVAPDVPPKPENGVAAAEDWHGNVKRSHWPR